jgi:hypothetical protein
MSSPAHTDGPVPSDEDSDGTGAVDEDSDGTGAVDEADPGTVVLEDGYTDEVTSSVALFDGDQGTLDIDQRRALVVLLKNRFISAATHAREWRALARSPAPITSRLNDLFMELHLDLEREVAFKRQVAPEGGGRPFPTLLYDAPWTREETIVLVYLRQRYRNEQAGGAEKAYVDRDDILDYVEQHHPSSATDRAGNARKAQRAVENVYKAGLLIGRSDADRFEISAAIDVLLPLEKLQELTAWLKEQNDARGGSSGTSSTGSTSSGDDANGPRTTDESEPPP